MSTTTTTERPLTVDEYAALPDDGPRTELVRGGLVREPHPGYQHARIQARLMVLLERHVEQHAPDLVCAGPFGVITAESPGTVRGPDLAVLRRSRLEGLHRAGFLRGAPELAVEIVSPSNTATEIQDKVSEYLGAGGGIVWVVYPRTRTVVVYDSPDAARLLRADATVDGGHVMPELAIPLSDIFAD